jgi:hypothetical protein
MEVQQRCVVFMTQSEVVLINLLDEELSLGTISKIKVPTKMTTLNGFIEIDQ